MNQQNKFNFNKNGNHVNMSSWKNINKNYNDKENNIDSDSD